MRADMVDGFEMRRFALTPGPSPALARERGAAVFRVSNGCAAMPRLSLSRRQVGEGAGG